MCPAAREIKLLRIRALIGQLRELVVLAGTRGTSAPRPASFEAQGSHLIISNPALKRVGATTGKTLEGRETRHMFVWPASLFPFPLLSPPPEKQDKVRVASSLSKAGCVGVNKPQHSLLHGDRLFCPAVPALHLDLDLDWDSQLGERGVWRVPCLQLRTFFLYKSLCLPASPFWSWQAHWHWNSGRHWNSNRYLGLRFKPRLQDIYDQEAHFERLFLSELRSEVPTAKGVQRWFRHWVGGYAFMGDSAMDSSTTYADSSPGLASASSCTPPSSEKENAGSYARARARGRLKFNGHTQGHARSITTQLSRRSMSLSGDEESTSPPGSPLGPLQQRYSRGAGQRRSRSSEAGTAQDSEILQELENSSLRTVKAASSRSFSCQVATGTEQPSEAEAPAFLADKKLRSKRSEGWLRKASRPRRLSGPPPRTVSGGTTKHIEHLESQVVSLQTQLQSFTSPAAIHSQASKMRTITAENRVLQQDILAWEQKFDERMEEQTQQHALIANSLKAQIRNLENERRRGQELQQELALELEQKLKEVETLEEAKADLERRLDFMSDIMAKSPGSLNLYSEPTSNPQVKRRPNSYAPPRSTDCYTDQLPRRWPSLRGSALSPTRGRPISHRQRPSIDTSISGWTEPDSDHSETTLVDHYDWLTHSRRGSAVLQRASTDLGQRPPNRRMRKFHSGSTGPRSLILAPSSPSGDSPLSATLSTTSAPWQTGNDGESPSTSISTARGLSPDGTHPSSFANENLLCSMDEVLNSENASLSNLTSPLSPTTLEPPSRRFSARFDEIAENVHRAQQRPETPRNNGAESGDNETVKAASPSSPTPQMVDKITTEEDERDTKESKKAHKRQHSLLSRILTRVSNNLDPYTGPARQVFGQTWQTTKPILMRPVVEFRWWLVQILLGDMSRKRTIWLRRQLLEGRPKTPPRLLLSSISGAERAIGLGLTIAEPPPYIVPSPNDCETTQSREKRHLRRRTGVPQAPPVTWLKFSMTLILAVGIAIKDGPASLFAAPLE